MAKLFKHPRTPQQREEIERLEITHDVVAPLVVRGRKEREERRLTTEAKRRRRNRLRIALDCVSVLLLFAVGALWFALQEKKQADKAAARARIEEDRSWIEGAKLKSARGDHFAAVLMAARALGFAGYGQEKIVDPQFKEEYPVLLTPLADPIEEQEARRQINEAALACYFGLPLWQTPMYRQDEGPVLIVAWSPVFQQNRRSRCDPKRVAPPECNMMVGESVLEQSANGG